MKNRTTMALAAVAFAITIAGPAMADESFNCNSAAVPKNNAQCQGQVVNVEGGQSFDCGHTRNADQATYCGAVFGYEAHWCARIQNPQLRHACIRDTE
jgi:uncharacterized protein